MAGNSADTGGRPGEVKRGGDGVGDTPEAKRKVSCVSVDHVVSFG